MQLRADARGWGQAGGGGGRGGVTTQYRSCLIMQCVIVSYRHAGFDTYCKTLTVISWQNAETAQKIRTHVNHLQM